ncbi:pentatricopeptide repeat-containing protein At1g77405-like isoform X1 [Arachis stenosperma]|uniref:pentatricopeptide repeat-containing protein At1g77405-like isoform X1 n=2 Tax=Arachis stenosperma TaxID=217475 RepID=UPI0025AD0742|nr:pentatricopeptide repeat-containing protein At1g77405-like isoform X1 [Arachis stenosperma]
MSSSSLGAHPPLDSSCCHRLVTIVSKSSWMMVAKPLWHSHIHLVKQTLAAIIKDLPLHAHRPPSPSPSWTEDAVSQVIRFIPSCFFRSPRSIGCQTSFRHRTPLRQRNLNEEQRKFHHKLLVLGPAAHRDPGRVNLGLHKALQFFRWVETHFGFHHTEVTCREMAIVLARADRFTALWDFLKEMSGKESSKLVTTETVTCLIKVLGEVGLANEALFAFYRMRQLHCRPDIYAYNTLINALCRVGNFRKARFFLEQMELPGFRCPPDTFTYTILISSYCRHAIQTGCKKATRRRLWEANHLFRLMLFKGFVPDVVTYNALIDGCCKTYRIARALELFDDMKKKGCVPNRVTYNSLIRYFSAVNEIDRAIEMLRDMQRSNHGVPGSSSYTPIIHALCEVGKVLDAWNLLIEMVDGGLIPREYTYALVCDAVCKAGESSLLEDEVHKKIKEGIRNRYRQTMKFKPIIGRKGYPEIEDI